MYLNEMKVRIALIFSIIQIIIGIPFIAFFGFAIAAGITGYDSALLKGLPTYVVMILPFLWLVWLGIRKNGPVFPQSVLTVGR